MPSAGPVPGPILSPLDRMAREMCRSFPAGKLPAYFHSLFGSLLCSLHQRTEPGFQDGLKAVSGKRAGRSIDWRLVARYSQLTHLGP